MIFISKFQMVMSSILILWLYAGIIIYTFFNSSNIISGDIDRSVRNFQDKKEHPEVNSRLFKLILSL